MKKSTAILLCLICVLVGFLTGRMTNDVVISYNEIKLPEVTGIASNLEPKKEEVPEKPILPMRPDTVYRDSLIYITQLVDTAAIIAEYQLKRLYEETLFDDSNGRMEVSFETQYNRTSNLRWSFTPIQQQISIREEKIWTPFIMGSYSTLGVVSAGGGVFYHKIGFGVQPAYDYANNKTGFLFTTLYKF